jgi:ankyrin repeat protein
MEDIEKMKIILLNSNFNQLEDAINLYNIQEQDKFGNNILHYYIKESKNLKLDCKDVIDLILSKGLDINEKQSKGAFKRSPLHIAVFMKLKDIVDYLIELGADVNSTDANGNSILMTAITWYRDANGYFIEKLINNGANIYQENNHGVSAYSLANNINSDVLKYFSNK